MPAQDKKPLDPGDINQKIAGLRGDQKDAFWRLYYASESRLGEIDVAARQDLIALFRQAAEDIQADVAKVFGQMGQKWDIQSMRRLATDERLFNQIKNRLKALGDDAISSLMDKLTQAFKQSYIENGFQLDSMTPPSAAIQFGLMPDSEIVAMLNRPFNGADFSDRLGHITDEMADKIKHELIRSMISQESWSAAARRIRDQMGTEGRGAIWRANVIARTELTRATEMAAARFHSDNGDLIEKVIWVAHPGACDECVMLNGMEIEGAEDYPPEASHPNCRCRSMIVPVAWQDIADSNELDQNVKLEGIDSWSEDRGVSALSGE